ncbi:MAG: hypothetical protein WAO00_18150, partial [Chthoniobacterales bacterium]
MADHRPGKGGHGFRRDLDRARDEELIVGHGENVQRPTRLRKATARQARLLLLPDEADVAAAFETCDLDRGGVLGLG